MTEQAKKNLEFVKAKFIPALKALDNSITNADAFILDHTYLSSEKEELVLFVNRKDGTGDFMFIQTTKPLSSYDFVNCAGTLAKTFEQE